MEVYITGTGNISPQKTFDSDFLSEIITYENAGQMRCIEPVYKNFIDPMTSRRMSRIMKMGFCAAKMCLNEAGIENPDAVIVGTGMGCMEDTEKFLSSLISNDEQLLNPTPFIQSTHNTVAAQIALLLKCHNYNYTYVHRGYSFESALLDAMMMISENSAKNILVGGSDELTNNFYTITQRLGHWKKSPVNNLKLLGHKSGGSIAGEGSTFFMLSQQQNNLTYAKLKALITFYKPSGREEVKEQIIKFLAGENLSLNDIDLVILGLNGDQTYDNTYYSLIEDSFENKACAYFKHLCGEYQTASAFALWAGANIIKQQGIPDVMKLNDHPVKEIRNILIYNHYRNINHSLFLISKC